MVKPGLGRVTVVTVVRNAASALEMTINSVLEQKADLLDYVVIDGASDDDTLQVIRKYEKSFKAWLSEPDLGVYDAMNKGWHIADMNSRVLFLGAGDLLISLPQKHDLVSSVDDVIYGDVKLENGLAFKARAGSWLKLYNSLHHQGLLIPRALHPEAPFDTKYPLYADFDFNQRLLKQGAIFRFSAALKTYAAPAGLTGDTQIAELVKIVSKNFGLPWSLASRLGFSLARVLPVMKKLKPVRRC